MRWNKDFNNGNVSDTRGSGGRRSFGGGRRGMSLFSIVPMLFRLLGFKGTLVVGLIAGGVFLFKPTLLQSLLGVATGGTQTTQIDRTNPEDQQTVQFIKNSMGSVNAIWSQLLGSSYRSPQFEITTDHRGSGPYYMPSNETIYLDPQFFDDLATKYEAPGDFAHAYVIAHEGAHHVQKILGLTDFVHKQHGAANYNQLSVRLELYADFLAGVWAHNAVKAGHFTFDDGDIEEAIRAAQAIGDDALQKKAGAWKIDPSKFTHGTSAQRMAWLKYGLKSGNLRDCHLFIMNRSGEISLGDSLSPPAR